MAFAAFAAWRTSVKNPLDSLTGTIVCGVLLTIILYFVVKALQPVPMGA